MWRLECATHVDKNTKSFWHAKDKAEKQHTMKEKF